MLILSLLISNAKPIKVHLSAYIFSFTYLLNIGELQFLILLDDKLHLKALYENVALKLFSF